MGTSAIKLLNHWSDLYNQGLILSVVIRERYPNKTFPKKIAEKGIWALVSWYGQFGYRRLFLL